jgi:signal transduction histidine kinase
MAGLAGPRALRQLLEAVQTLASDLDLSNMLRRIVQSATELADAEYGALGVLDPSGTRLAQFITVGIDEATRRRIGDLPEGHGILGLLIRDAKPLRLPNLQEHRDSFGFPPNHPPMASFLGVPITVRDAVFGNLYLTDKRSGEVFTDIDEELVVSLAGAAGIAIENARLSERVRELALTEDRERIARDLHDTVIQRLFATGMSLQSATSMLRTDPTKAAARIELAIDDLDTTIKEIRTAIFALEQPAARTDSLRSAVLRIVQESVASVGFEPRLMLHGPIDTAVPNNIGEAVLATLRESLSNVAKHASATVVDVELGVGTDVELIVRDNGVGLTVPGPDHDGHGLKNIAVRAGQLGGTLSVERIASGGTLLTFSAPLD